jgi:hypothetical protein
MAAAAAHSEPTPTSTLPPSLGGDTVPGHRGGVDYVALWQLVDAEAVRVVVVDLDARAVLAGRALGEAGSGPTRQGGEAVLERLFPGASSLVERWRAEGAGAAAGVASQALSPRQWVYYWRIGANAGLLAVVHHRYGRGAASTAWSASRCPKRWPAVRAACR